MKFREFRTASNPFRTSVKWTVFHGGGVTIGCHLRNDKFADKPFLPSDSSSTRAPGGPRSFELTVQTAISQLMIFQKRLYTSVVPLKNSIVFHTFKFNFV
jgi:hypothetical protein